MFGDELWTSSCFLTHLPQQQIRHEHVCGLWWVDDMIEERERARLFICSSRPFTRSTVSISVETWINVHGQRVFKRIFKHKLYSEPALTQMCIIKLHGFISLWFWLFVCLSVTISNKKLFFFFQPTCSRKNLPLLLSSLRGHGED